MVSRMKIKQNKTYLARDAYVSRAPSLVVVIVAVGCYGVEVVVASCIYYLDMKKKLVSIN